MNKKPRVLLACEESQAVTKEMRKIGIDAWSCDIEACSGGKPEWHINQDVRNVINDEWDMIIAFPPCTYLTVTGNKWMKPEYHDRFPERHRQREDAVDFFMMFAKHSCKRVVIENPIGIMSSRWRKPDQIVQPYWFGHKERKSTCLWIKGVDPLVPTEMVDPEIVTFRSGSSMSRYHYETVKLPAKERSKLRSKTFSGLAAAMANQWGPKLISELNQ